MSFLRSIVYNIFYVLWTAILAVISLPILFYGRLRHDRMPIQRVARLWVRGFLWGARVFLGLRYRLVGLGNVPQGAVIFAAKHQSAFETFIFHAHFNDPVYILKKELMSLPLVGWYLKWSGQIPVQRKGKNGVIKAMLQEAEKALDRQSQIVIFPEGTRVSVGEERPFYPGIALLYTNTSAPVIPVAVNSGLFWPRNAFVKKQGVVTIEFMPPVERGLSASDFTRTLQDIINSQTRTLERQPEKG